MFKKCKKLAWGFLVSAFVCGGSVAFNYSFALPDGYTEDQNIGTIKDIRNEDVKVYAKIDGEVATFAFDDDDKNDSTICLTQLFKVLESRDNLRNKSVVKFEGIYGISGGNDDEQDYQSMISIFPNMREFRSESLRDIGESSFAILNDDYAPKEHGDSAKESENCIRTKLDTLLVPKVDKIGYYALANNYNLKNVDFSSVSCVEGLAFCDSLQRATIKLPKINELRKDSFSGCLAERIIAGDDLKVISQGAFQDCENLQAVEAKNIEILDDRAFYNCPQLIGVGEKIHSARELEYYRLSNLQNLGKDVFHFSPKIEKLKYIEQGKVSVVDISFERNEIVGKDFYQAVCLAAVDELEKLEETYKCILDDSEQTITMGNKSRKNEDKKTWGYIYVPDKFTRVGIAAFKHISALSSFCGEHDSDSSDVWVTKPPKRKDVK